jgi:phage tail-like protein
MNAKMFSLAAALVVLLALMILFGLPTQAQKGEDPKLAVNFSLELNGAVLGYFSECTGMGSESEIIEHKIVDEGGNEIIRKIPGRIRFYNVECYRGVTSSLDLWQWRKLVEDGDMTQARKNAEIVMYNKSYNPLARWTLSNTWPSALVFGVDAGSAVEYVVLVSENTTRTQ